MMVSENALEVLHNAFPNPWENWTTGKIYPILPMRIDEFDSLNMALGKYAANCVVGDNEYNPNHYEVRLTKFAYDELKRVYS